MTTFTRVSAQGGHYRYELDGEAVTSVTAAIGVLDKPALVSWAASMSAGYAVDNWEELSTVGASEKLSRIEKARYTSNRAATVKGSRIHSIVESIMLGETVEVPESISKASVEAAVRLMDEWGFQTIATELPVASETYWYAGTADVVAYSPRLGNVLLDWKTSRSIYDEVALQLAAYRYAEVCLKPVVEVGPRGGKKTRLVQEAMPRIDRCMAVHIKDDAAALHPIDTAPEVFDQFVRLLYVHDEWIRRVGWKFRGESSYRPVVHAAIYPEISDAELEDLPR